jgi:hydrogenase nickel incorporation protein HypB
MTQSIYTNSPESNEHSPLNRPPKALIRKELSRAGILAVRLIGPPGSGKTELIQATIKRLAPLCRVAVIVVNPAAGRDAARLRQHCRHVESIDASAARGAFVLRALAKIPLKEVDLILIESCGGLAPLEDVGQDATVATFGVSCGDDKAAEYHALLEKSSVVLLTQIDMRPLVKFDEHVFRRDVQAVNAAAEIFELSAVSGSGMNRWLDWLDRGRADKKHRNTPHDPDESSTDAYFG